MSIALIILILITTWLTLRDPVLFGKYSFEVDKVLIGKEYFRIVTSGFLHVDWLHFAFNAIALYLFGEAVEAGLTIPQYLLLYFGSLVGGSLLALYIHREHGDYSAVGASGAISGIVFAYALLFPGAEIGFILVPIHIDAVIFCFAYVLISIYGIGNKRGNIAHEAHLGGAVTGLLLAVLLRPELMTEHRTTFLILFLPTATFLAAIYFWPGVLLLDRLRLGQIRSPRERRTEVKSRGDSNEEEIDRILDKINQSGIESLSKKEREMLERRR